MSQRKTRFHVTAVGVEAGSVGSGSNPELMKPSTNGKVLVAEDLAERLHDLQIAQSTAPDESDEILAKPESDKETADSTLKESIVQKNDEGRRDDEESVAQASVPQPVAQRRGRFNVKALEIAGPSEPSPIDNNTPVQQAPNRPRKFIVKSVDHAEASNAQGPKSAISKLLSQTEGMAPWHSQPNLRGDGSLMDIPSESHMPLTPSNSVAATPLPSAVQSIMYDQAYTGVQPRQRSRSSITLTDVQRENVGRKVYQRGRFEVKDFYLDSSKGKMSSPLPVSPKTVATAIEPVPLIGSHRTSMHFVRSSISSPGQVYYAPTSIPTHIELVDMYNNVGEPVVGSFTPASEVASSGHMYQPVRIVYDQAYVPVIPAGPGEHLEYTAVAQPHVVNATYTAQPHYVATAEGVSVQEGFVQHVPPSYQSAPAFAETLTAPAEEDYENAPASGRATQHHVLTTEFSNASSAGTYNQTEPAYSSTASAQYGTDSQANTQHHSSADAGGTTILVQHPPVPVMTVDAMGNLYTTSIQPAPTQYYVEQATYATYDQATGEYIGQTGQMHTSSANAGAVYTSQADQMQPGIQYIQAAESQQPVLVMGEQGLPLENAYVVHHDMTQPMSGVLTMAPQGQAYQQYYMPAHDPALSHLQPVVVEQAGYSLQSDYVQDNVYVTQPPSQQELQQSQYAGSGNQNEATSWHSQAESSPHYVQEARGGYADTQNQYLAQPLEEQMNVDGAYLYMQNGEPVADQAFPSDDRQSYPEQLTVVHPEHNQYSSVDHQMARGDIHELSQPYDAARMDDMGRDIGLRASHSTTLLDGRATAMDYASNLASSASVARDGSPKLRSRRQARPHSASVASRPPSRSRTISPAVLEPKVNLIVKQSQNIGKMMSTLSEIYNPPGDHSETYDILIKELVDIRMKVIKLAHDNQKLRQEKELLLNILAEDDRKTQEANGNHEAQTFVPNDLPAPGPLMMNDPTAQFSEPAVIYGATPQYVTAEVQMSPQHLVRKPSIGVSYSPQHGPYTVRLPVSQTTPPHMVVVQRADSTPPGMVFIHSQHCNSFVSNDMLPRVPEDIMLTPTQNTSTSPGGNLMESAHDPLHFAGTEPQQQRSEPMDVPRGT